MPQKDKVAEQKCPRKVTRKEKVAEKEEEEDTVFECGQCNEKIESDDRAILCDGQCGEWFHADCSELPEPEYKLLSNTECNIMWYCRRCVTQNAKETSRTEGNRAIQDKDKDKINKDIEEWKKASEKNIKLFKKEMEERLEEKIKEMNEQIKQMKETMEKDIKDRRDKDDEEFKEIKKNIEGIKDVAVKRCTSEEVKGILDHELQQQSNIVKSTVRNTVIEEVAMSREKNIIVYRAEEGNSNLKEENIKHDKEIISELMEQCKVRYDEDRIEKIIRLGRKEEGKTRPLLIKFQELDVKKELFKNLSLLKNATDKLKNLSISNDMTQEQREENKKLLEERKRMQEQEPAFIFKIRGPPWNRYVAKMKRDQDD